MSTTVTRKCRQTGTLITVGSADELGLDADGGACAHYTICETHGTCIGHTSRRLADSFSSVPKEWCEFCDGTAVWCAIHEHDRKYCACSYGLDAEGGAR